MASVRTMVSIERRRELRSARNGGRLQAPVHVEPMRRVAAPAPQPRPGTRAVRELQGSLRTDVWDGAAQLSSIYAWLHSELVRANVRRDPAVTSSCLDLVVPLAEAWREAALAGVRPGVEH